VADDDLQGWTFDVRERSAGVYEATGTHVSGASVGAVGGDPDDLLKRLRQDARSLVVSSAKEEIPGRVTVGLAGPIFLGVIMYDLANDPGVAAAPSPFWVAPLFFVAGLVVGLLWPAPAGDGTPAIPYSRGLAIVAVGSVLGGTLLTLLHPPPEVFYWSCAVGIAVIVAIMTASVKSARRG
jgi:hypothetical protein